MRCWRPERRAGFWLVALVALATAALLAGCGNEKRDFLDKRLNPLVKQASQERASLAALLRASRPRRARDEAALQGQLSTLASVFRRIASLKPPDGVEARFLRYTRANAALVRALARFIDAFTAGEARAEGVASQATRSALARANRAERGLQQALR